MVPSYGLIGQEDQTDFRNPVDPDAEIIRVSFSDEIGRFPPPARQKEGSTA